MIIIPAYQEAQNIQAVIQDVARYFPLEEVVVVNDGSTDGTGDLARRAGVTVIDLPFNMGIGAVMQTGFRYARDHGAKWALQIDGDHQHPAKEAVKLLKPIKEGEADLVIGSRYLKDLGYPVKGPRRLGSYIFQLVNRIFFGRSITDATSGFRAYSRRVTELLADHYLGEYPEPEVIGFLLRRGGRILEIPVQMRLREGGVSSITPRHAVYYMIRVLISLVMMGKANPEFGK
jgi:glycosyltransferase involved in cell wall biosynthesis